MTNDLINNLRSNPELTIYNETWLLLFYPELFRSANTFPLWIKKTHTQNRNCTEHLFPLEESEDSRIVMSTVVI